MLAKVSPGISVEEKVMSFTRLSGGSRTFRSSARISLFRGSPKTALNPASERMSAYVGPFPEISGCGAVTRRVAVAVPFRKIQEMQKL